MSEIILNDKPIIPPYRVGVALSGGGARGFAHLGALKAMQEIGLQIDVLSGVSAGSVAAVLFSSGVSVEKAVNEFNRRKFRDFTTFNIHFNRKSGLLSLNPFEEFISEMTQPYRNLEDLPIPTYIGVTDFDSGTPAEFHTGEIAPRVVASCSIPIVFPPKSINGVRYVDGGVVRNLPAWTIRDKCKYLIGINCSPIISSLPVESTGSLLHIAIRTFSLMSRSNQKRDIEMCDFAVEFPEISNYKVFNLKQINDVFLRGYTTMHHALSHSPVIQEILGFQKESAD